MFSVFSCRTIEDKGEWLNENLDIECWSEDHTLYAYTVALPSIIIWGIGTPTLLLLVMIKNRKKITTIKNKLRFGFLFNGYRKKTFYWEFVILYRKILIICLIVFAANYSTQVKALTVLFLLLISFWWQHEIRPFNYKHLNRMESLSILVATVTIYCGLYYLTRHLDEPTKMLFFIMMVFANIAFIGYWMKYMTI